MDDNFYHRRPTADQKFRRDQINALLFADIPRDRLLHCRCSLAFLGNAGCDLCMGHISDDRRHPHLENNYCCQTMQRENGDFLSPSRHRCQHRFRFVPPLPLAVMTKPRTHSHRMSKAAPASPWTFCFFVSKNFSKISAGIKKTPADGGGLEFTFSSFYSL